MWNWSSGGHKWQNGTPEEYWLTLDFLQNNNLLSWQQYSIVELTLLSYKQVPLVSNHYMRESFNYTVHDSVNVFSTLFWIQS